MASTATDGHAEDVRPEDEHQGVGANVIEIPLYHDDGEEATVTVDLDNELAADPEEMCTFLENERCAPNYWLAIAMAYARKGQILNAAEVLNRGIGVFADIGDKISFHSCLSWLYLRQLRSAPVKATDPADAEFTKEMYHRRAMQEANKAIELGSRRSSNGLSDLANGALTLASGDFDRALGYFQASLNESGNANLFAQLGKARVLYHKKNYKQSLQLYQSVLVGRPDIKPDPRIGIGLCLFKLGDKATALAAWERAHELDPTSPAVNTLLGLFYLDSAMSLELTSPDFVHAYTKGMGYIQAAYKVDSTYSAAGVALSGYLFSKKDMDKVLKLDNRALEYADVPTLRSDAYLWMARAYHYLSDYEKALQFYEQAEKEMSALSSSAVTTSSTYGPSNVTALLPTIGKGLVQLAQNSPDALLTFENIVATNPKCSEALLILGLINARQATNDPKRKQRALSLLEKYLRITKEQNDVPSMQALLTLSRLTEDSDLVNAQSYLEEVVQFHKIDGFAFEIYNNLGVFNYMQGNLDASKEQFKKALECETGDNDNANDITVKYNMARLEDAMGNMDEAKEGYNQVLASQPEYTNAKLRLAFLAFSSGTDPNGEQINALLDEDPSNLEARALYGWLLRRQKRKANDDTEQKHHKTSLVEYNKHDNFALISLGNLYLQVARELRVHSKADMEKKERTYFKASEFFDKALQIDPYNAFAAQGVAIIFAETKRPEQALQIFGKIRESLNDLSIHINLGHCLVEMKQFAKAIESYELAVQKSGAAGKNDSQLMTLLGRAWYARGVSERNVSALQTSLDYSKKASELSPDNLGLKFNVAFVQFQIADAVRSTPSAKRSIDSIEQAAAGLEEAIVSLQEIAKAKSPPYPAEDLEQRAIMGQNTLRKQLERALSEQREYESENQSKLEEARKKRQEEMERLEEEKKKKAQEEEELNRKLAEERAKLQEQAREWVERAREEAEREAEIENEKKSSRKKKGSSKKKDDMIVSDNEVSEPELSDLDETELESKNKSEKTEKANGSSTKKKAKSKAFIDSDDDAEAMELDQEEVDSEERKRKGEDAEEGSSKKRRIIESDEEEGADAGADDLFGDE
uniref:ARAD1D41162p n=1 Tax=Blastobotrys adeninivorans TaxID=409370 RepID=A0A060TD88_BLAAD